MPEPHLFRGSFLEELKRRKVVRVAIVYAAVAWVTVQVADVALPAFEAPDWVLRVLIALLVLGFPVVLALAWAFDVTPDGLRVTPAAAPAAGRGGAGESTPGEGDDDRSSWMSTRAAVAAVLLVAAGGAVGWLASERPGGAERDGPGRAIAVLPFANLAGEQEQYFVDGIHDDILTQLSRIEDLTVISRTSMLRYRDTEKGIPEIAAELGVGSVLEGSVQKRGERVRITAQLIDAGSDAHLWADSYDETLDDYFAIQTRIATEIASALRATLTPEERERVALAPTQDTEALDRYLRGTVHLGRWWGAYSPSDVPVEEELAIAAEHFEAAVGLDPRYALAWARLSETYSELVWSGARTEEFAPKAKAAVEAAEALDPGLPEAAYSRALYLYHVEGRYGEALDAFDAARRLAPNDPRIERASGWVVRRLGRFERAIEHFERAHRLDPLGQEGWKTLDSYLHARRYDRVRQIVDALSVEGPEDFELSRAWFDSGLRVMRDGDLAGADRILAAAGSPVELAFFLDDPLASPLWPVWIVGLEPGRVAALADSLEPLLPTLEGSSISYQNVLGFRAWALHDALEAPGGDAAAAALEAATERLVADAGTEQNTVHLLARRAFNYLRLDRPEAAVALADSLVEAFPVARDAWWMGPLALRAQAGVYARVGREEEAIDILLGLVPPPSWYTPGSLRVDPAWEPLRDHPRFADVIEAAR